jgi:hypothetical protein
MDGPGGAENIVCRHAAAVARKFIAAIWAADALENAVAHQRLQDLLKMPGRQTEAGRESFGRNRPLIRGYRNFDHCGDRQQRFAREHRHSKLKTSGGGKSSLPVTQGVAKIYANASAPSMAGASGCCAES